MKPYKIKTGFRLTVADPENPGQALEKFGGDVVELDDEAAQQYADALEPVEHQAAAADHTEA